ncbi:hypothetical protein MPER_09611 [Moniliophthora perniciosa FA553]|nr:hypothetical protein MPER_09611 [Moniliophthora perniciosa FA553]
MNHGLILVIGSQLFLALVNVAVKKLNTIDPPVPVFELILIRQGVTYAFSMFYIPVTWSQRPLKSDQIRTEFSGVLVVMKHFSIFSLSDATVLTSLRHCVQQFLDDILEEKLLRVIIPAEPPACTQ